MFDRFGEFDSVEEMNKKAEELRTAGDEKGLIDLAEENGIDKEDAEDYMDGCTEELATPLMAAIGKIKVEEKDLGIGGILSDWKDAVIDICTNDPKMQRAVREKKYSLKNCMATLLKFAFENKVQVSNEIVKATKVKHNGKEEQMRGPVYLGIPNKKEVNELIKKYYGLEG